MYSHIMVGANDIDASKKVYDAILGTIGHPEGVKDERGRVFWITESGIFSITTLIDGNPATAGKGCTIGFAVSSPEQGDAWHATGLANGGTTCEDTARCARGGYAHVPGLSARPLRQQSLRALPRVASA